MHEELTWVGKAVLLLCKGAYDRAQKYFETVLSQNKQNTPALLGQVCCCFFNSSLLLLLLSSLYLKHKTKTQKACIAYNQKRYADALRYYRLALEYNPNCPANVRLGLGLCFYRLNRPELAKQAFRRVLELEEGEDNAQALAALAVLELNTRKPSSVHKAMNLLKQAYEADPNNAVVLNHLSNHFFYKKDYRKAISLAQAAFNNTQIKEVQAESYYYLGRACHAQGEYDKAIQYYYRATTAWPEYVLAQYGLGQMYMHNGDHEKAITCFNAVLKKQPDNFETLRALGCLYTITGRKDKATASYKRIIDTNPNCADSSVWLDYAQLLDKKDPPQALTAYETALNLLEKEEKPIPPELLNNIGSLHHYLGNFSSAEAAYRRALSATGASEESFKAKDVTTLYNLARLYESQHKFSAAERLYKELLKEHPNYVDCYLRLGCIAREKGQIWAAGEWFKETFTIDPNHADAWSLLANLHLQQCEWIKAQKRFEHIIANSETHNDQYALLSLGNIYYIAKFEKKEKEKRERFLNHALDFYWKVLLRNPNNIYAANGIGIIMAEKGNLNEAKDFFIKVRETTASMADVWVNLAHIYLAQGQFVNAIKMYQNCLRKFYDNKDPNILLFLAKAFYEDGRLQDCKNALLNAIHITPDNLLLWYNLALSQESFAVTTMNANNKSLKDMQDALKELKQAIATWQDLANQSTKMRLPYHVSKAQKHLEECEQHHGTLLDKLKDAKKQERDAIDQRNRLRQLAEQVANEKQKEEAERVRQEAEEQERLRLLVLQDEERVQQLLLAQDQKEVPTTRKSSSSSSKKGKGTGKGRKGRSSERDDGDSEYSSGELEDSEEEAEMMAGEEEEERGGKKKGKKTRKQSSRRGKSKQKTEGDNRDKEEAEEEDEEQNRRDSLRELARKRRGRNNESSVNNEHEENEESSNSNKEKKRRKLSKREGRKEEREEKGADKEEDQKSGGLSDNDLFGSEESDADK
ncbi:protein required for normal CLN1 and CLN2 G1 cyclin expression, variant 3 [Balamuthia mandrillaris]